MIDELIRVKVDVLVCSVGTTDYWKESQGPARDLRLQPHSLEVRNLAELDRAFDDATRARVGGLLIPPHPLFATNFKRIADLSLKHRTNAVTQ